MNASTTVGIEVRAEGTREAARDLAAVDASLKKINTGLGGTAQLAGAAAQGLSGVGASAKKASESLGSVAKLAASAKFDKMATDLGAMGVKLNTSSLHAQKLARAMQQVERERAFRQLAQDAGLSTVKLAAFRAELGDTRGALATLTSGFAAAKLQILAWAAALALGGKAALDAALQMDRLDKAYTTIYGSGGAATSQLAYLHEVSNRLGLQFQQTAASAKTFFAAGKDSSLAPHLNEIFEAVSSAGAALSLSQDDMQGVFLALGQMISKGKVQAEELRGQLGERLPGAFQLAAKAMGMTTAQLDKFMADGKLTAEDLLPKLAKVMQSEFGAAAEAAANGIQGSLNRLSTQWELFKTSLIDSDAAVAGINTLRGAIEGLNGLGEIAGEHEPEIMALGLLAAAITAVALARKLGIVESVRLAAADVRLHGVQATLADRFFGVDSAERQRLATEKALQSESVKAAQANVNEAQAVQRAALASEQAARQKLAQAVAAKESAVTSRQVQNALAREAAATSALHAAQVKTYAATNALGVAQQKLSAATNQASAAIMNMGAGRSLLSGLKAAAGGLVSFLGGPWGVAFMAAAAGLTYLTSQSSANKRMMSELADEYTRTAQEAANAAGGVGKMTEEMAKQAKAAAQVEVDKAEKQLAKVSEQVRLFGNTEFGDVFRTTEGFKPVLDILQSLRTGAISVNEALDRMEKARAAFGRDNQNVIEGTQAILAYAQAQEEAGKSKRHLEEVEEACARLGKEARQTKEVLASPWVINLDDAEKGIAKIEQSIRGMQAQMLGLGKADELVKLLPNVEPEKIAAAVKAYGKDGLVGMVNELGEAYHKMSGKEQAGIILLVDATQRRIAVSKQLAEWQKKQRDAAKDHTSASRYIENIRAEISKLNGDLSASWEQKLKVKLDDIARKGEDAHLSLDQLNALTKEYAAAADAKRVRDLADAFADLDLKIAQAAGNTRKVKDLDIAKRVEEERRKLEALAKTPEEKTAISEKLRTYKTSLETEVKVENLQVAADFYEKLAALSGDYSVSTAYQNQLLEAQAEIYRRALGPEHEKFIQEWEKLSRLQNSRDLGAGLERSVRSFIADSTNGARQFEDMFTNAFQSVGNIGGAALEEIFEKGSFAVDKYFANISRQIAILAANAATNQLIGGIFGFLANGLSFGGTATANAVSESTAVQGIMSNIAPVRLCHDGGRVETSGTSRAVPLSLFENAPRYHAGGFLRPDERPAILQTGEQVLSRGDTAGLGGKLDQLLAVMRGVADALRTGNGQGAPSVVIVDDNSKIEKYMRSPEGARTFLFQMNQNRAAVKNVAQGGRA